MGMAAMGSCSCTEKKRAERRLVDRWNEAIEAAARLDLSGCSQTEAARRIRALKQARP
jgi:hypothetical protein